MCVCVCVNTPRNTVTWFWLHDAMFDLLKNRLISPIFRYVDFAISISNFDFHVCHHFRFPFDFRVFNSTKQGGSEPHSIHCPNEDGGLRLWYLRGTPRRRTCNILIWQGAKPRTPFFPIVIRLVFEVYPIMIRSTVELFPILLGLISTISMFQPSISMTSANGTMLFSDDRLLGLWFVMFVLTEAFFTSMIYFALHQTIM